MVFCSDKMMPITGIVAEFNPFHQGHQYLLDQVSGLKIIVMSGNWVQRGEPAIFDKWSRAQSALDAGADIVVELPTLVSVQGADFFAQGAIDILKKMGMTQLAFGTESDVDYNALAYDETRFNQYIQNLPSDLTYPQKAALAWQDLYGVDFSGDSPNHILALAYKKRLAASSVEMIPIKRQGSHFHDTSLTAMPSASAIRRAIFSGEWPVDRPAVSWQHYYPLLKYRIETSSLLGIHQVDMGLRRRIKGANQSAKSFEDLVDLVHTKRVTKARIRRCLTYILLNIKTASLPQGIHVLGFSTRGQEHLATLKKQAPLVSKIGQEPWDEVTQRADRVYIQGDRRLREQNHGRMPIRVR